MGEVNKLEFFVSIIDFILQFLPKDPFINYINAINFTDYLGVLNWFIPISEIITILTYWLGAISSFYLISVVLRKAGVI